MDRALLTMLTAFALLPNTAIAQLSSSSPSAPRGHTMDFVNVTAFAIISTTSEADGNHKDVVVGDFDNDGDADVVIGNGRGDFTKRRNKLYRNDAGLFQEITGSPAIPSFNTIDHTRSILLHDFDDDGWLDMIVVNDDNAGDDSLYLRNVHPDGVFSHFVAEPNRLPNVDTSAGGGIAGDFDNDSDLDVYITNHPFHSQDRLLMNDGTGHFTDATSSRFVQELDYGTDAEAADINSDGKLDVLMGNMFDASFIVYNDLQGQGNGVGNFRYSGSVQSVSGSSTNHPVSMEAADFDGDGDLDIYLCNFETTTTDVILTNQGNNANGRAQFLATPMPGIVSDSRSRKSTITDLNRDGRPDVVVMGLERRPVIFRNTSVQQQISFVEWTPAATFPIDSNIDGFHAAAIDANQDHWPDLFIGGNRGDHLILRRSSQTLKEQQIGAQLPALHDQSPVAILGNGVGGESDVYTAGDIPAGATLSVVARSRADLGLRILNSAGIAVATSDRGGMGIEEALQVVAPANPQIEITVNGAAVSPVGYVLEILSRN